MQGTIKSYFPEKLYGFIIGDDGRDYFFHAQDLLDSRDIVRLCEAVKMQFAPTVTPKGDRAKALMLAEAGVPVDTYLAPDRFLTSAESEINGWTVLERSDWLVHGSGRGDPAHARSEAIFHAQSIGANGLLELEYFKTTGSEPGTGSGIHHFTIHHYRGRAAVLGKRHAHGQPRLAMIGVNAMAEIQLQKIVVGDQNSRRRERWWLAAALIIFVLLLFSDGNLHSLAPLYGVILGVVVFARWHRRRSDFKNAPENAPLFYAPLTVDSPRRISKSKRMVRPGRESNRQFIRSFVVDESKLTLAIQARRANQENQASHSHCSTGAGGGRSSSSRDWTDGGGEVFETFPNELV